MNEIGGLISIGALMLAVLGFFLRLIVLANNKMHDLEMKLQEHELEVAKHYVRQGQVTMMEKKINDSLKVITNELRMLRDAFMTKMINGKEK